MTGPLRGVRSGMQGMSRMVAEGIGDVEGTGSGATDGDAPHGALESEVRYLRNILRCTGDMIVVTDADGLIVEWNESATRILGWTREDALGTRPEDYYIDPKVRHKIAARLDKVEGGRLESLQVRVKGKDGRRIWILLTLSRLKDEDGQMLGTVGCSTDITERKRLERELRRVSISDQLTGLYNQSHFFHELEREKERALRLSHDLSLLLCDLDLFKELNDTRGHLVGDQVLREVGGVIFESIRKGVDQGFRYGGDEFTVLLPGADLERALRFAERIRRRIERLNLGVTASMGICPFDPANRSLQIVKKADQAMYMAKKNGGNGVCAFDPATNELTDVTERLKSSRRRRQS